MTTPTDRDPEHEAPLPETAHVELEERVEERPLFQHPEWMLGIVLILALAALFAGIAGDPVWLLIGSPFIVTLGVYLWARFARRG